LAISPLMWVSRGTPVTHLKCHGHQLTAMSSTTIPFHKLPLVPSSQHLLVYLLLPKDTRILAQNPLHCCQQSTWEVESHSEQLLMVGV
jgi:hypothetical protein